MERKLVTLRQVNKIEQIPNADKIEIAHIDGWQCVVKKGEFIEGDYGVYFEVDSYLPITERFEFLRKGCYKKMADGREGFRLKTVRLRGVISQGLLLPLENFHEIGPYYKNQIGEDLSELLGVTKYEPPIPAQLAGVCKGTFPSFIPKTDAERIENLPGIFEKYKDFDFEETEKLHGTSCTYYYKDGEFGACSRNLELKETPENTMWKIAKELMLPELLKEIKRNIAIQGELCGEGINKNPLKLIGQKFYVFDIYDIDKQKYLEPDKRLDIVKGLGLDHVPILSLARKTLYDNMTTIIKNSNGESQITEGVKREGVVYKSYQKDEHGNRIRFKAISREYLLMGE